MSWMLVRPGWLLGGACLFALAFSASGIGPAATLTSSAGGSFSAAGFELAAASFVSPARGWVFGRGGCSACASLRVTTDGVVTGPAATRRTRGQPTVLRW
jgi:hypothetical protein